MNETACGIVNILDRSIIELTGIISVDSFDEFNIILNVECGTLNVEGENLNITVLDLERGVVKASGKINAVVYADKQTSKEKGVFSRMFGGSK